MIYRKIQFQKYLVKNLVLNSAKFVAKKHQFLGVFNSNF